MIDIGEALGTTAALSSHERLELRVALNKLRMMTTKIAANLGNKVDNLANGEELLISAIKWIANDCWELFQVAQKL